MKEFLETIWKMIIESNVLSLLSALIILITGWLVALILSTQLRKWLRGLAIDEKIGGCVSGESKEFPISKLIARIVYFLVLAIAILAALTAVNLTQAAEPIKNFADTIVGYAANLLGAAILGVIAWIVASILRFGTLSALKVINMEKVAPNLSKDSGAAKIIPALGGVVYWVVLLFFLPSILRALKIQGITEPLQAMFTKVMEYLPNLLGAVLILFFGFLAAKIVRNAVTGFLLVTRMDELGEKAGVSKIFGNSGLSSMIGIVVYALVAIPVIISSLTALKIDSLSKSVSLFFDKILNATGDMLGAGLLIFVAVIAGGFVAGLVTQMLENFGFNRLIASLGFVSKDPEKANLASAIAGKLAFVAILFMALVSACDMLHFSRLSDLLKSFMLFGGNLILAVIVMMIGLFLANLSAEAIRGKGTHSEMLAFAVRLIVIIFTAAIALHNLNIGSPIVQTAFSLILGAICVAAALAFGLGGRDFAARKLEEWNEKFRKK